MGVLPGITHEYRHINSDDFGGHLVLPTDNQERNIRTRDRHVIGLRLRRSYTIYFKGWDHARINRKIISNILITSSFICDKITTKGPVGIVVIVISSSDNDR